MGGLARPSLVCFLNLALTLAGGLSAVPSAGAGVREGGLLPSVAPRRAHPALLRTPAHSPAPSQP